MGNDVPFPLVTVTFGAAVTPLGTIARILVGDCTTNWADVPSKETSDALLKSVPRIVTRLPAATEFDIGVSPVTAGTAFASAIANWLFPAETDGPAGDRSVILTVPGPCAAVTAVILLSD